MDPALLQQRYKSGLRSAPAWPEQWDVHAFYSLSLCFDYRDPPKSGITLTDFRVTLRTDDVASEPISLKVYLNRADRSLVDNSEDYIAVVYLDNEDSNYVSGVVTKILVRVTTGEQLEQLLHSSDYYLDDLIVPDNDKYIVTRAVGDPLHASSGYELAKQIEQNILHGEEWDGSGGAWDEDVTY